MAPGVRDPSFRPARVTFPGIAKCQLGTKAQQFSHRGYSTAEGLCRSTGRGSEIRRPSCDGARQAMAVVGEALVVSSVWLQPHMPSVKAALGHHDTGRWRQDEPSGILSLGDAELG